MKSLVFYSVISISAQKWEPIYSFCVDLFESIAMEHYKTLGFSLILRLSELVVNLNNFMGMNAWRRLQAASVFWGPECRPDRAEGNLYVHGRRPGRAEGALHVQPTCLDVQIILCTVKLSRNSIY